MLGIWIRKTGFLRRPCGKRTMLELLAARYGAEIYAHLICCKGLTYMPSIENAILFVEDDEMTIPETFARDLTSLLQNAQSIKGLVIGRFQRASKMTEEQLLFILDKHPLLKEIPVLYDVDFGHTQPMFTFPIGGEVQVDASKGLLRLVRF